MNSSLVAIKKKRNKETIKTVVRETINLLGGINQVVSPGNVVLIKPNVLAGKDASTGATTSPEIVGTITKMCYEAGAKKVIIAESSNWGINTFEAFKACGYFEMAEKAGAELLDLKKDEIVERFIDGYVLKKVRIPKTILDVDTVINIPVLKTHSMTKVTLSLKNVAVGISTDDDKQRCLHHIGIFPALSSEMSKKGSFLDYSIADINMISRSELVIIDGLIGLQGLGAPLLGKPVKSNIIIAGFNRVSVDAIGSKIIGYEPSEINHIKLAADKGLGEMDIEKLKIRGENLSDSIINFEKSFLPDIDSHYDNINVVYGGGCEACRSTLNYILIRHKEQLESLGIPITIYLGKDIEIKKPKKEKRLYVHYGNCAGELIYGGCFVPGCPPRSRRQFFQAIGALDLYKEDEGLHSNR
ncbi:DUF362 domain-containing protein [Thermoanaerobacteraceae bacterium SP2]|jgi:uncharacterized protein (DUF362 family)|nr:DUF362 domain-containing protein [Thermoanaerobacteraceae bacterium SP2]